MLLAFELLAWCSWSHGFKASHLGCALALLEDKEQAVRLGVHTCYLSAWAHFPDTERVERLKEMVKHVWPFVCQFIERLFREIIEPAVQGANAHLSTFTFTKVSVGQQPLRVSGVKVYAKNVNKRKLFSTFRLVLQEIVRLLWRSNNISVELE